VPLEGVDLVSIPQNAFLCPGFVDTHTHAPQFAFAGLGYDLQLLEWLETYTFPSEAKFKDLRYAETVCRNAVRRTLTSGSTSCVYFGTLHTDAAVLLGHTASAAGQRAFVGKVNMDRNAPDTYRETTQESIAETERFLKLMLCEESAGGAKTNGAGMTRGPRPVPVITPRFVPTCSSELMRSLGESARRHNLLVQSHVSENRGEVEWVSNLHPEEESYTAVYDTHGLLGERTLLAHGVYLEPKERILLRERGATVAHCPMSNSMLRSGMLNVRRLITEGVHVSLGTDVSGGASPSMLSAIREALKISNMVSVVEGSEYAPLTYAEAFWLATAGGARALGVEGLTGNFGVGSVFDALVIQPDADGPIDLYEGEGSREAFQKWLQLGDDRNTAAVYVEGRKVWSPPE
jgi:guanine deaminase